MVQDFNKFRLPLALEAIFNFSSGYWIIDFELDVFEWYATCFGKFISNNFGPSHA